MLTFRTTLPGLVCLWLAFGLDAAHADAWKQVPLDDSPLARERTPETYAALKVMPATAEGFGALLAAIGTPASRAQAFGPTRGKRERWEVDELDIAFEGHDGQGTLELELDGDVAPPASVVALPLLEVLTLSCDQAVARLGRPTSAVPDDILYGFRSGERVGHVRVRCSGPRLRSVTLTIPLPMTEASAVPKRALKGDTFEGIALAEAKGPKRQGSLWPFGFAVAPTAAELRRTFGAPFHRDPLEQHFAWGTRAVWDTGHDPADAPIDRLVVYAVDRSFLVAAGAKGRELAWLGGPRRVMDGALGPPTVGNATSAWWVFRGARGFVTVIADFSASGLVDAIGWFAEPLDKPSIEACGVNVLEAPDTTPPAPAIVFHTTFPERLAAIVHPWGVRRPSDVVRRLGAPSSCQGLEYPGLSFHVLGGRLMGISISDGAEDFLRSRGLDPTFVTLLGKSDDEVRAYFGDDRSYLFIEASRGRTSSSLRPVDSTGDGRCDLLEWSSYERDNADELVTGIDLWRWPESTAGRIPAAAGAAAPGVEVGYGQSVVVKLGAKPWLAERGIGGRAVEALGRPWLEVLGLLGRPAGSEVQTPDESRSWEKISEPTLEMRWGIGRSVVLRCHGPDAICDELELNGEKGGVMVP